jgi:hypothetical protein
MLENLVRIELLSLFDKSFGILVTRTYAARKQVGMAEEWGYHCRTHRINETKEPQQGGCIFSHGLYEITMFIDFFRDIIN